MRSTQLDDVLERAGLSAVVLERLRRLPVTHNDVRAGWPQRRRARAAAQAACNT